MKDYLTTTQACEMGFGSYAELRKLAHEGKLHARKSSGRVYYKREDLEALMVERYFEALAATAPKLTPKARDRLAALLGA